MLNESLSPYGVIYGSPGATFLFGDRLPRLEKEPTNIKSVAIIGAGGQTGRFYLQELTGAPTKSGNALTLYGVCRDYQVAALQDKVQESNLGTEIGEIMAKNPEVVIVATPNPTNNVLKELAQNIHGPTTIVLPQNGVDVVSIAREAFQDNPNVHIVRASMFTSVIEENGELRYKREKRRIVLAPVLGDSDKALEVEKLFKSVGFETAIVENYRAMECTKLLVNCFNMTGVVTGLSIEETFADPELFQIEWRALRDRIKILEEENIPIADIPWIGSKLSMLKFAVDHLPYRAVHKIPKPVRLKLARMISGERGNNPPAAVNKLKRGKPTEIPYYLNLFIGLAAKHGSVNPDPIDRAILDVIRFFESMNSERFNFYKDAQLEIKRDMLMNQLIAYRVFLE